MVLPIKLFMDSNVFMRCECCGKIWSTINIFLSEPEVLRIKKDNGIMYDNDGNPVFIFYKHALPKCGTALAVSFCIIERKKTVKRLIESA